MIYIRVYEALITHTAVLLGGFFSLFIVLNTLYPKRKILRMNNIDLEHIKDKYDCKFYRQVESCIKMRKNLRLKQSDMAYKLKKSLKTIQNFENKRCFDYFLIFAYNQLLK